jgi:hypothetical protein
MAYALLTEANHKTLKSQAHGYYTTILHLLPYNYSGHQVCPKADGCEKTCLAWSGRGPMPNTVAARLRRTKMFFEYRPWFMGLLINDIFLAQIYAKQNNLIPVVRLNGTSDLPWEKIRTKNSRNIFEEYPDLQFYDYTKIPGRRVPDNYALTFSLGEDNQDDALRWLEQGGNVAAIYDDEMPDEMLGYPTINGDEHDLRFLDPSPCVVALKRKRTWVPMQFQQAA